MWRALILLSALAAVFVVVLLTSAPSTDRSDHPDSIPPGYMQALGKLTAPFAPKLDLGASAFELLPGSPRPIAIPASKERSRIATLTLRQGSLVQVSYCPAGQADCGIEPPACLVPDGKRPPGTMACARQPGVKASVAAQQQGGTLTLLAPSERAVVDVQ